MFDTVPLSKTNPIAGAIGFRHSCGVQKPHGKLRTVVTTDPVSLELPGAKTNPILAIDSAIEHRHSRIARIAAAAETKPIMAGAGAIGFHHSCRAQNPRGEHRTVVTTDAVSLELPGAKTNPILAIDSTIEHRHSRIARIAAAAETKPIMAVAGAIGFHHSCRAQKPRGEHRTVVTTDPVSPELPGAKTNPILAIASAIEFRHSRIARIAAVAETKPIMAGAGAIGFRPSCRAQKPRGNLRTVVTTDPVSPELPGAKTNPIASAIEFRHSRIARIVATAESKPIMAVAGAIGFHHSCRAQKPHGKLRTAVTTDPVSPELPGAKTNPILAIDSAIEFRHSRIARIAAAAETKPIMAVAGAIGFRPSCRAQNSRGKHRTVVTTDPVSPELPGAKTNPIASTIEFRHSRIARIAAAAETKPIMAVAGAIGFRPSCRAQNPRGKHRTVVTTDPVSPELPCAAIASALATGNILRGGL